MIEYTGEFYEAIGKRLVLRGGHHAYRYEFRHLEHGDIIRGVLLRYPPEGPAPPDTGAGKGSQGASGKAGR